MQVDAYAGGTWHTGTAAATPTLPSGVTPSAITGLRVTFAGDIAPGATGSCVVNLEQRATSRTGGTSLAPGATVSNTEGVTVTTAGGTATASAAAQYQIRPLTVQVNATKSISPASIPVGGSSTVTVGATNNSGATLTSLTVAEPGGGTFFDGSKIVFGAFTGSPTWPTGATAATLTWTTNGAAIAPVTLTQGDPLPTPADPSVITGFSITYTGVIADGAQASLAFTADAGPDAGPATSGSVSYPNTVKITGTNLAGTSSDTASATLAVTKATIAVTTGKSFTPNGVTAIPGRRIVASLTASPAGSTASPTDLVITDPVDPTDPASSSTNFWNSFNARAVSAAIPAGSTMKVEVYNKATSSWVTLATGTGPQANYVADVYALAATAGISVDNITGIRMTFHDPSGYPASTTVKANVTYAVRATDRTTGGTSNPPADTALVNCAGSGAVRAPLAPAVGDPACDTVTVRRATGSGVSAWKAWDQSSINARSQGQVGAELGWAATQSGVGRIVVSDPGTAVTPVSQTVFQAFDLVSIAPITTATDPYIQYDAVSKVELYNGTTWVGVSTCTTSAPCKGSFPGYTLTAAEQASTEGVRLTFIENPDRATDPTDPNAPEVGSGVTPGAASGASGAAAHGNRPIDLTFQIRDTVRQTEAGKTDLVVGSRLYNDNGTPAQGGVVDNTVQGTAYNQAGTLLGTDGYDDTIVITDSTPVAEAAKTWSPDTQSLPPAGATQADYPTQTLTLSGANKGAMAVDNLTITDPSNGTNPFDEVTITGITSVTAPTGATGTSVVLTNADGTTTTLSGTAATALTPAQLATVVGVSVTFTGRILPHTTDANVGSIVLATQVRATTRTGGAAVTPGTVANTLTSSVDDASLHVTTPATGPVSTTASAVLTLNAGSATLVTNKTISPTGSLQAATNSPAVVELTTTPGGSIYKTKVVVEDSTPTFWNNFNLTGATLISSPGGADQVQVDYRTDTLTAGGGSITVTPAAAANGGWNLGAVTTVTGAGMDLSAALPAGLDLSTVTGLRFTFTKTTGPIANSPATIDLDVSTRPTLRTGGRIPSDADPVAPGETVAGNVTNTVKANAVDTTGATVTATPVTAIYQIKVGTISVEVAKAAPNQVYPGTTVSFQLIFQNDGTGLFTSPVMSDTLPAQLIYDPTSVIDYVSSLGAAGLPAPSSVTYDSTTRKVSFGFPAGSVFTPGEIYTITLPLQIAPGMPEGTTVINTAGITSDRTITGCSKYAPRTTYNATLADNTCSNTTPVTALKFGGYASTKDVKAQTAAGGTNTTSPGTACVATADGFYRYPCAAISQVGQTDTWRLNAVNGGNINSDQLVLLDVLPHVGDTGVVASGVSRQSAYRPVFDGNINLTTDTLSAGTVMTTYYSTSDTPCTADLTVNTATPCAAGDWTSYTAAVDPTTVKALKFTFDFTGTASGLLPPAATLKVTYNTINAPFVAGTRTDGAPITQNTDAGIRAWNSFGIGGEFVDGSNKSVLSPAEPRKAGIALATGPLQVTKVITGAAKAFAPTSFGVTASCTIAGQPITLTSGGHLTLNAANSYTDRIDGIPAGATCSLVEDGTAPTADSVGSYGESTRTVSPDSVTIARGAATAAVPSASKVTATNDYPAASVAVTKKVDTTATAGSFGPFHVTLVCNLAGDPVTFTDGRLSFDIVDGQTVTVTGLPVGAVCSVSEDKTGAADAVSISVDGAKATDGPTSSVTVGDAGDTALVTNHYGAGTLSITKSVTGTGSDLYGTGTFTAHVACVYNTQSLYDQDVTIKGGQTVDIAGTYPAGTVCTVTEPKNGGANSTTISTGSVTIVDQQHTTVDLTNIFDTGTLQVIKVREGDGKDLFGVGPFTASVSCTYQVDGVTTSVLGASPASVVLSADNKYTASVVGADGPLLIPVGAVCLITEPKTLGANSTVITPNDGEDEQTGVVTIGKGTQASVTVTNTFNLGSLKIVKDRIGSGVDLFGAGPFTMAVACTYRVDGVTTPLDLGDHKTVTLGSDNGYTATISNLPVGANCTVAETGTGGATGDPAYSPADPTNPAQAAATVTADLANPVTVTVTNTFTAGSLQITKVRDGAGAEQYGAGPFVVAVTCTYLGQDFTLPAADAAIVLDKANGYTAEVDGLPIGAICSVTEIVNGGSTSTVITPNDATVTSTGVVTVTGDKMPVTVTNTFDLGSINIVKVRKGTGVEKFGAGPFTMGVTCTIDLGDGGAPASVLATSVVLDAANGYRTSITGLPLNALCKVTETDNGDADSTTMSPAVEGDPSTGVVTVMPEAGTQTLTVTNYFGTGSLEFGKTVDKATAKIGDKLTYTIKVHNTGELPAVNVKVSDTMPVGVKYLDATPTPTTVVTGANSTDGALPYTVNWTLPLIEPGQTITITVTGKVLAGTNDLVNSVGITNPPGHWIPPVVLHPCTDNAERSCATTTRTSVLPTSSSLTPTPTSTPTSTPITSPITPTVTTTTATTTTGGGGLAYTGVRIGGLLTAALVLLGGGLFLLVGARRRREQRQH